MVSNVHQEVHITPYKSLYQEVWFAFKEIQKKGEKVEKVKQCLSNRELLANNGAGYSSPRLTIIHDLIFF